MKTFRRISQVVCAGMVLAAMAAVAPSAGAYSDNGTGNTKTVSSAAAEKTAVKKTAGAVKYGKVTAVSSANITVELGELKKKEFRNGEKKDNKNDGSNDAQNKKDGRKTGDVNGELPRKNFEDGAFGGTAPEMKDGNRKKETELPDLSKDFTSTGSSLTVAADGVKITKMGKEAKLSDIKSGDYLTLVYNGSELTEIKIGLDPFGANDMGKKDLKKDAAKKTDAKKNNAKKNISGTEAKKAAVKKTSTK